MKDYEARQQAGLIINLSSVSELEIGSYLRLVRDQKHAFKRLISFYYFALSSSY